MIQLSGKRIEPTPTTFEVKLMADFEGHGLEPGSTPFD
jgi:hypothetical protein